MLLHIHGLSLALFGRQNTGGRKKIVIVLLSNTSGSYQWLQ